MVTGLALASYAVVIGISGSVLVFRDELTALAHPEFHRIPASDIATTPDQALAAVRAAWPAGRPISVTWPNEESPYWMSYVLLDGGAREVFVNPSTGKVVGGRDPAGGWVGWLLRLHTNLLAGRTGRLVNGWAAWLLASMCVTGLLLWLPADNGSWRKLFRLDMRAGWRRFSWQLHHLTGAIALPFIFVLAITGTYFIWSSQYVRAVGSILPSTAEPKPQPAEGPLLDLEEIAARAGMALPGRAIQRIQVVDGPAQAVRATMREGSPAEFHLVSTVFLHPVTGEVLLTNPLDGRPAGDAVLAWLSALHFGVFGKWPVRLLWSALGLSLPALAITGCLMWWRRVVEPLRRKERQEESRPAYMGRAELH